MEKKTFFEKLKEKKRRQFDQKEQVKKDRQNSDVKAPSNDLDKATEEFDDFMSKLDDMFK